MKPTKTSDLRNLKSGEIETKLSDAREELMKLRFQAVTGQLTDSSRLRVLRRRYRQCFHTCGWNHQSHGSRVIRARQSYQQP